MPLVLHTGFDNSLARIKNVLGNASFESVDPEALSKKRLHEADLVLVGPGTENILRTVQAISRADSLVSTIVVPYEKDYAGLKQSLLFTPYVSRNISIFPINSEELGEEIDRAATLTGRRRNFARINASIEAEVPHAKRKSEGLEQLGHFLDQAPIGAVIVNKQFGVVALNVFARRLFNVPPLQSVGRLGDLVDKASAEVIEKHGRSRSVATVLEILSNARYYEVHFATVTNPVADDLQIILFADITERKLESQRIRSVLDSLPQMAWTANALGEVTYFTKGWYSYTGQTFTQAMGKGWTGAVHEDDREALLQRWQQALEGGQFFEAEARYRRQDGQYRWHLVRGTPMTGSGGNIRFWIGTCTDIHDQKNIQKDLSEQVRARTRELTQVNELLKKSNEDLRQFAYVASHDLKEPVRKIKIFLDRFEHAKNEESRTQYFEKVRDAATRMGELIDGIMAYSQLSAGVAPEEVDLNELIGGVQDDLEVVLNEKNATLRVGKLPVVRGIRLQLGQLFSNLILNSLKYTERRPEIEISHERISGASVSELGLHGPWYHHITVRDNGIGFNPRFSAEIFQMFKRLHSKSDYAGAGIGLALVKKIVINHNGAISVESEEGKGSVFHIYLPDVEGSAAEAAMYGPR